MTKKDYILLEESLRDHSPANDVLMQFQLGYAHAVYAIAAALKTDNGRFDMQRFTDAVFDARDW